MTNGNGNNKRPIERLISWVGSMYSLAFHTVLFIVFFVLSFSGILSWDSMFLILTTIVSLEAIYMSIFIQMTVNRQAASLHEVEQDIDEIQEDVEELSEDVEELSEDPEEEARKEKQMVTVETLTRDVQRLLTDLEALKNKQ